MSDSLFGGWVQESDASQSRRIRELTSDLGYVQSRLSQASSATSALRSDLASLRGSIEVRLTRLTAAFDAFVELSSLRDQLALVAGPALVRQAARARLVALGTASTGGPVLDVAGVPEAPGYWLADALGALGGDDDAAERSVAVDRTRTATFLTLAGAVCARPELVTRWFDDALGTVDATRPVTRAQRALWVAAAHGHLGEPARRTLRDRLGETVAALPSDVTRATLEQWALALRTGRTTRENEADAPALPRARQATASLAALRETLQRDGTLVGPSAGIDGPPADDATAVVDPAVDDPVPAELAAVLRALVDEGAEQERALTTRIAELEAVVAGKEAPGPAWDAPAGDLLTLLGEDVQAREDAVGATAREVCGAWLVTVADTYLADAEVDPPEHLEVSAMGSVLRARADGPVEGVEAALVKVRTPLHPRTPRETALIGGAAALAVLLWVASAVDTSGLRALYVFLALTATAAAVALGVRRLRRSRDDTARAAHGVDVVRRESSRAQERLRVVRERVVACRDDAREHHAAITAWHRPWTGSPQPAPTSGTGPGDTPVDA